jgi:hypothetical protein
MKVLGLDTSTSRVTVALIDDDVVINELSGGELNGPQFHGELLASLIKDCLGTHHPELIAVGRGPGPYTGLRVGIVTATVLASTWGLEVIGVPTLAAIAAGHRRRGGGDCVAVLDVKRREIAYQSFSADGDELSGASLIHIDHIDQLPDLPIVGPAFETQRLVAPSVADNSPVSAVDIAQLALEYKGSGLDIGAHPIYLREPDAAEPKANKSVLNG